MTLKLSERELEELLRQPAKQPKPPADLLARLRADLPAELEMALLPEPSSPAAKVLPSRWTRPLISLAASLAVLAGGSLIAYRSFRESALPAPASEAAAVAPEPAAVAQQARPPDELKTEDEQVLPADVLPNALRADAARSRSLEPQAEPILQETLEKNDLPLPVAEQLKVAPPPAAPPPRENLAGGAAAGILQDAKERDAALESRLDSEDGTALREEVAAAAPPAALEIPLLENPGIEANSQQTAAPEPQAFGESDKRKETRRLESPSTQGDGLRPDLSRAAAAAAPKQVDKLSAGANLGDAWRQIERELAGGGWPSKEAIAAARGPENEQNGAPAARSAPRGAEPAPDPSAQLREDLLDYLARREHGRHFLLDLRRRAIRLAEKRPDDERVSSVLRIINLAVKLSPD